MGITKKQMTVWRCRGCSLFPSIWRDEDDVLVIACNTCSVRVEGEGWEAAAEQWNEQHGMIPRGEGVARLCRRVVVLEREVSHQKRLSDLHKQQYDKEINELAYRLRKAETKIGELQDNLTESTNSWFKMHEELGAAVAARRNLEKAIKTVFSTNQSSPTIPTHFWVMLGTPDDLPDEVKEAVDLIRRVANKADLRPCPCSVCGSRPTVAKNEGQSEPSICCLGFEYVIGCPCGVQIAGDTEQQVTEYWNEHMKSVNEADKTTP